MIWFLYIFACNSNSKTTEPSAEIIIDADGDGFAEAEDCNDSDATINPSAEELCDGSDNNCDGNIDEDVLQNFYVDADGDGFGHPDITIEGCSLPNGFSTNSSDCDDTEGEIYPGAEEICDGLDNDCDDLIDPELMLDFYVDADGDGFGDPEQIIQACAPDFGIALLGDDCNDLDANISPFAEEICDGIDNNCDGDIDENLVMTYYRDQDEDGFGHPTDMLEDCTQPEGYVQDNTDCDDLESYAHPDMTEVCDGIDNDCDGNPDNDALDAQEFYPDIDGDGFGANTGSVFSCVQPPNTSLVSGDCNDTEAASHPANFEICDDIDNNCDGTTDEASAINASTWYLDADQDGFGLATSTTIACAQPTNHVDNGADCDDTLPEINPDTIWYQDADQDGFGNPNQTQQSCTQPMGYSSDNTDCNDLLDIVYVGAEEICDELDNDCDGTTDNNEEVAGDEALCAKTSCNEIINVRPSSTDGYYWIDPDGLSPFEAYCDMSTNGGGWTLLGSFVNSDGTYNWTQFASGTNNLPNWTNENTFGDLNDYMSADYKSPAMWRLEATDLMAMDDGGEYASFENALQTNLRDTLTGYSSCQTSFLTGVTVKSSNAIVETYGKINFYGSDPNDSHLCPLNFGANSTDASVIALAHQGCGTTGFGHVGYYTGSAHQDRDHNFCLKEEPLLNTASSCGSYYGESAIHWFFSDNCSYSLLFAR